MPLLEDDPLLGRTSPATTAYIELAWCEAALANPAHREVQADGRIRFWHKVTETVDGKMRYLRVVTLSDGETVHNAFFDRDFREDAA